MGDSMKRYYIEVDVEMDNDENYPEPQDVTYQVGQGLPKEFFIAGDDWHIRGMRVSADGAALAIQVGEQRAEIAGLENALTEAQTNADRLDARNNELIAAKVQVRTEYTSVGITDDEVEALVDALSSNITDLYYSSIEDVNNDIDRLLGSLDDTIRESLPIMDERDLGWGDDDDLSVLEAQAESAQGAVNGLIDKLDAIRTGR